MSFGFSVGDIASVLATAARLSQILTLNQSGDESLSNTLHNLETVLTKLKELKPSNGTPPFRYYALVEVSTQCQTSMDRFSGSYRLHVQDRINPNQQGSGYEGEISRQTIRRRLKWSQKAITIFRAEAIGHILSLLLLTDLIGGSWPEQEAIHQLVTTDRFCLKDIQRMNRPISQEVCAFDLHNSLVDRTMRIISTNLRIYNAVIELQHNTNKVPQQVELQSPVILEDALGRKAPFHLDFVTSPKALHEVLILRFNNEKPLQSTIESNNFILFSERQSQGIDLERPWSTCFSPGDRVEMSLLLQVHKKCLLCGSKVQLRQEERIACDYCSTHYQPLFSPSDDSGLLSGDIPSLNYSIESSPEDPLPRDLQKFIIEFLSEEFTTFPEFEIWGPSSISKWEPPQFFRILAELLQCFASDLSDLAKNEFERRVVQTILHRRLAISSSLKALVLQDRPKQSSSYQFTENSRSYLSPSSINESSNEDVQSKHDDPKSHADKQNYAHRMRVDRSGQCLTDPEQTLDEKMATTFLTSGNALQNLSRNARRSLYFDFDPQAKFWAVDSKIMEGLRARNDFKNGNTDEKISVMFKVFWELCQFSEEELEGSSELGPVITLSGSAIYACATQCKNYLEHHWSNLGLEVLKAIESALSSDNLKTPDIISASSLLQITVELHRKLHRGTKEYANIKATGDLESIKQVAHCLTWLTAAVRVSPYDRMSYSDALFTDCTHLAAFSEMAELQNSMYFEITAQSLHELSKEERKMCWNRLFPHSVIADGFPIPKRSTAPGLEISFDVMTSLSGVSYPMKHTGGLVLQGLTTMLVPTQLLSEDGIQWHFLAKPKGSRMTLREVDTNCKQWYRTQDITCLQKSRAFLRWSKEANIYLGTKDMDYARLKYTKAISPQQKIEISSFSLGIGSGGMGYGGPTGTVNFTVGKRRRPEFCLQKDQDMEAALRTVKMWPVILYDVEEQRGWLVSTLSVILHLAHVYARVIPELVTLNDQLVELPYALPSSDGGEAALKAILENQNLPIHISAIGNESSCFMDLIKMLYFSLMALMEKDSHLELPKKPLLHSQPLLCGWELMSVLSSPHSPQPKERQLQATSGGWTNFASDVLVLFGDGLGDIIRPSIGQNHLCNRWVTIPKWKDYLTANISMLQVMSGTWGYSDTCHKVGESVQWIQCEDLFPDCRHPSNKKCHAPLQKLKKLDKRGRRKLFENQLANKPPGGAVIFGKPTSRMKFRISRGSDDERAVSSASIGNGNLLRPGMQRHRHDSGYSIGDIESEDANSADEGAQSTTEPSTPMDPVTPDVADAIPEPQRAPPAIPDRTIVMDAVPRDHAHVGAQLLMRIGSLLRIGWANVLPSLLICWFALMFTQGKLMKWPNYECLPNP